MLPPGWPLRIPLPGCDENNVRQTSDEVSSRETREKCPRTEFWTPRSAVSMWGPQRPDCRTLLEGQSHLQRNGWTRGAWIEVSNAVWSWGAVGLPFEAYPHFLSSPFWVGVQVTPMPGVATTEEGIATGAQISWGGVEPETNLSIAQRPPSHAEDKILWNHWP